MPASEEELEARIHASDDVIARGWDAEDVASLVDAWSVKADALFGLRRWAEALAAALDALMLANAGDDGELEMVAQAMRVRVFSLQRLDRLEEALVAAEELLVRFESDRAGGVGREVAAVATVRAAVLGSVGRVTEAEAAFDAVVDEFGDDDLSSWKEKVVLTALMSKARLLREADRLEDALAVIDGLLERFEGSFEDHVLATVARARNDQARMLSRLGRQGEASATYRALFEELSLEEDDELRGQAAVALYGAATSDLAGHETETAAMLGELISRYSGLRPAGHMNVIPYSMLTRSLVLRDLGRIDEAVGQVDDLLQRFGQSTTPTVLGVVAQAMVNKARCLHLSGRLGEEKVLLDEVVTRFADSAGPRRRAAAALALFNQAVNLREVGSYADEIAKWDELDRRFGADPPLTDPWIAIRGQLAKIGTLNWTLKRVDDALAGCDALIARCATSTQEGAELQLAEVMALKRDCLATPLRIEELLGANRAIIDRFANAELPALQEIRDSALVSTVQWSIQSGQFDAAIAAARQLTARFSTTPRREIALKLLTCAQAFGLSHSHDNVLLEVASRALLGTASTIQNVSAAIWEPPRWLRVPDNRWSGAVTQGQQRYEYGLELAKLLDSAYQTNRSPAMREIAMAAHIAMTPALLGLGRPVGNFKAVKALIQADDQTDPTSETRRKLTDQTVPVTEAMFRALAIEELGDPARTIAAFDDFLEQYSDQRSPAAKLWVLYARNARRKARKQQRLADD